MEMCLKMKKQVEMWSSSQEKEMIDKCYSSMENEIDQGAARNDVHAFIMYLPLPSIHQIHSKCVFPYMPRIYRWWREKKRIFFNKNKHGEYVRNMNTWSHCRSPTVL